jgi:hypothetical protein
LKREIQDIDNDEKFTELASYDLIKKNLSIFYRIKEMGH